MKIVIGITQEPQQILDTLSEAEKVTLTEIGPFVSKIEAANWLDFLKSQIGEFEEILAENQTGNEAIWYGFTFEK